MNSQTENTLGHICVIGVCTAVLGTLILLIFKLFHYLNTLMTSGVAN